MGVLPTAVVLLLLLDLSCINSQRTCRLPSPKPSISQAYDRLLWNEQLSASKLSVVPPAPAPNTQLPITVSTSNFTSDGCWLVSTSCFFVFYHKTWRIPVFTAHKVNINQQVKAGFTFRKDVRLENSVASVADDYKSTASRTLFISDAVDEGQFIPAGNLASNCYNNAYIYSNVALQPNYFTRDCSGDSVSKWKLTEYFQEELSKNYSNVYVITGALDATNMGLLNNRVKIPREYFKIIMWCTNKELKVTYCKFNTLNIQDNSQTNQKTIEATTNLKFNIQPSTVCGSKITTTEEVNCNVEEIFSDIKRKNRQGEYCTTFAPADAIQGGLGKSNSNTICSKVLRILKILQRRGSIAAEGAVIASNSLAWSVLAGKTVKIADVLGLSTSDISLKIPLRRINLDCSNKEIQLQSRKLPSFEVIPKVLQIQNTILSMKVSFAPVGVTYFGTKGEWLLGNLKVDITTKYYKNMSQLQLRARPRTQLHINLNSMIKQLTGTSVNLPLPSFTIRNIMLRGTVDLFNGGSTTIVLRASVGTQKIYTIFQKPHSESKYSAAVAIDLNRFKLSTLLKKTLRADISSFPFFGSLTVPRIGVILSTGYIDAPLFPETLPKRSLLKRNGEEIYEGLWSSTVLQFRNGQQVPVILTKIGKALDIKIPKPYKVTFKTLIDSIGINFNSVQLPPINSNLFNIGLTKMEIHTVSGEMLVELDLPNTLKYFDGQLVVRKPMVLVMARLKAPRRFSIIINGEIIIGNNNYAISILKRGRKYILEAAMKTISLKKLSDAFSADSIPSIMKNVLRKFSNFEIQDVVIRYPLFAKPLQIHLAGAPVISGYKNVIVNLLIVRIGSKTNIIQGYVFNNVNLMKMVETFTGINLGIGILDQNMNIPVVIAPQGLTRPDIIKFDHKLLNGFSISKGVSLKLDIGWPSSCSSDTICKILSGIFGRDFKIKLQGTFQGPSGNRLAALLPGRYNFGGSIAMKNLHLFVKMGKLPSVGVKGTLELRLKSRTIILKAEIAKENVFVKLKAETNQCIANFKWLSICNLRMGVVMMQAPPHIRGAEFGGQFRFGCNPAKRIIANGYFGIDKLDPRNNYFYVRIDRKLTFQSFLEAICINIKLPGPLGDSGFPNGFLASYSLKPMRLSNKITISAGQRFKGTIRILGLQATIDVTITQHGMSSAIYLPVIQKRGLKMAATCGSRKGPYMIAKISRGRILAEAKGCISILKISVYGSLKITEKKYEYTIGGRMLGLFEARLKVSASSKKIASANFFVQGYFTKRGSSIYNRILGTISGYLNRAKDKAKKMIGPVVKRLDVRKKLYNYAAQKLRNIRKYFNRKKSAFVSAENRMNHLRRRVDTICSIRKVRTRRVCVPCGIKGKSCVKHIKAWGKKKCVIWRPRVRYCCKNVPYPTDVARNTACHAKKYSIRSMLKGASAIARSSRYVLNKAMSGLRQGMRIAGNARKVFDAAKGTLKRVKNFCKAGTAALKYLTRGMSAAIKIRKISFTASLSKASTGYFQLKVEASIASRWTVFNANIQIGKLKDLAKHIANKLIRGVTNFVGI